MEIPSTLFLEDEDGNAVEMEVIASAIAEVQGEQRTYLALYPADWPEGTDEAATVVRFLAEDEAIMAIEDDAEFNAALEALDMDSAEETTLDDDELPA